jgi:hypothetical protein
MERQVTDELFNVTEHKRMRLIGKLVSDQMAASARRDHAEHIKAHQFWDRVAMELGRDIATVSSRHWRP